MSQNPEVKLVRNTELAFTEAHLTYLNRKIVQSNMQCSSWFSARGAAAPTAPSLWLRHWAERIISFKHHYHNLTLPTRTIV